MTARLGVLGLDTVIPELHRCVRCLRHDLRAETFDAAGQGAAIFNRKIVDIARRNLSASFDLAKSLAGAKSLVDMVELHAAYWRKQIGALTAQAEEVRELSTKVTADAAGPITALMASGRDQHRRTH